MSRLIKMYVMRTIVFFIAFVLTVFLYVQLLTVLKP